MAFLPASWLPLGSLVLGTRRQGQVLCFEPHLVGRVVFSDRYLNLDLDLVGFDSLVASIGVLLLPLMPPLLQFCLLALIDRWAREGDSGASSFL